MDFDTKMSSMIEILVGFVKVPTMEEVDAVMTNKV